MGSLAGTVRFPGETPAPYMYANRGDHDCPHGIGANHLLVRQESLGLQNAIVIVDFPDDATGAPGQARLTTVGCTLKPRIQAVTAPGSLHMQAKDKAHHRLHAYRKGATAFELDLPESGDTLRRPIVDAGFYRVDCDRHLWERAWIYVSPHPYVAVTDPEGRFLIKGLPPGRYAVRVWHEGWVEEEPDAAGRPVRVPMGQTREVAIKRGKATEVIFDALEKEGTRE